MPTEKEIFDKLQKGEQLTMKEAVQILKKPIEEACVAPIYVYAKVIPHPTRQGAQALEYERPPTHRPNELVIIRGNTKQLEKEGIHKKYGGYSHSEPQGNGRTRHEVWINTDTKVESQIVALAHEIGHHVLKGANLKEGGKTQSEERAKAFQRVAIGNFNKRYGDKYNAELSMKKSGVIKPSSSDTKIVQANIKPIYIKKGCKLSRGLKL